MLPSLENIIISKDNPVLKLYRRLSSSKKERARYGLFVLEGFRIVRDAVRENAALHSLRLTEQAAGRFSELTEDHRGDARRIIISDELGRRISSTQTPQGVFAICHIPRDRTVIFGDNGRYIALCGLQDPGNLGMIIRTADALGIDGALLCGCCDLYSPKTIRSTMGSVFRMRISLTDSEEDLFGLLSSNGVETSAAVIDKDAEEISSCGFSGRQAVLIGNEGSGLSSETAARCTRRVTIPMNGTIDSLNAAMAAGILMWELRK